MRKGRDEAREKISKGKAEKTFRIRWEKIKNKKKDKRSKIINVGTKFKKICHIDNPFFYFTEADYVNICE